MSGTSLDGLDLCLASFNKNDLADYKILKTAEYSFPESLKNRLRKAHLLTGYDLALLSNDFAFFCSEKVNSFKEQDLTIDLIASHGHTVFHDPKNKLTTQIGNGAVIYSETKIKTICDFRTVDVALGGQGAPLVPIGDLLLFPNSQACLNLGGIANISYKKNNAIKAQDLCFANMALNYISKKEFNEEYDRDGKHGKQGILDSALLNSFLKTIPVFKNDSLGREGFEKYFLPLIKSANKNHVLRTVYEYISIVISDSINEHNPKSVLITGGGAFNTFLVSLIKNKSNSKITVPEEQLISFKEALIFAFLGTKRILNEVNCLAEVTGSEKDNIGGCIYG